MDGTAESADPAPKPGRPAASRVPLLFAIAGVVVALAATGLYLYRQAAAPRLTAEETVDRFLSAVFVASSPDRLDALVCASWDAQAALTRTVNQVSAGTRVSWNEVSVVTSDARRATVRANLGLRFPDDVRPTTFQQWHFSLVNEGGWRVCEARPFRV